MTKPTKSKTGARIRASELYRAAASKRGAYSEISRLLALEGYGPIAINTLRTWALRDGWREPRMNEKAVKKYHAVITERLLNSEQPVRHSDPLAAPLEAIFFQAAHASQKIASQLLAAAPKIPVEKPSDVALIAQAIATLTESMMALAKAVDDRRAANAKSIDTPLPGEITATSDDDDDPLAKWHN